MAEIDADKNLNSTIKDLQEICKFEFNIDELNESLRNEVIRLAEIKNKRNKIEEEIEMSEREREEKVNELKKEKEDYLSLDFFYIIMVGIPLIVILLTISVGKLSVGSGIIFGVFVLSVFGLGYWHIAKRLKKLKSNYQSKFSVLESEKNSYHIQYSNLYSIIMKELIEFEAERSEREITEAEGQHIESMKQEILNKIYKATKK